MKRLIVVTMLVSLVFLTGCAGRNTPKPSHPQQLSSEEMAEFNALPLSWFMVTGEIDGEVAELSDLQPAYMHAGQFWAVGSGVEYTIWIASGDCWGKIVGSEGEGKLFCTNRN